MTSWHSIRYNPVLSTAIFPTDERALLPWALLQAPDLVLQIPWGSIWMQTTTYVSSTEVCLWQTHAIIWESADVLNIWNLNLKSVSLGHTCCSTSQHIPSQQKSKQTKCRTKQSPLNASQIDSEGSSSLPCQWINKRVQLLINVTQLSLPYTTIIISCKKGSQSQRARAVSGTRVTQQIIYCFLHAGKALEAKGVSKLPFERQWKKNLGESFQS